MEKFDKMLEALDEQTIENSGDWLEDIPKEIYDEYFNNNFVEVAWGLNVDTHRWYEISTTVIKIFDRYLGIRHVTNLFSEQMSVSDCYVSLEFSEKKQVTVISYE